MVRYLYTLAGVYPRFGVCTGRGGARDVTAQLQTCYFIEGCGHSRAHARMMSSLHLQSAANATCTLHTLKYIRDMERIECNSKSKGTARSFCGLARTEWLSWPNFAILTVATVEIRPTWDHSGGTFPAIHCLSSFHLLGWLQLLTLVMWVVQNIIVA